MSLEKWIKENRLSKHKTSQQEIQDLFRVVARDKEPRGQVYICHKF